MKKLLLLIVITLVLPGCAMFQDVKNVAPVETIFSDNVKPMDPMPPVEVQTLPEMPKAQRAYGENGEPLVGFTVEGLDQLRLYRAKAEANTQLANDLVAVNNSVVAERNAVARLGKLEEARANYLAQQWKVQADEADKAKRDQRISEWGNRLLWVVSLFLIK